MKRQGIISTMILLGGVALFFIIIGSSAPNNTPLVMARAGGGNGSGLDYTIGTNRGFNITPASNNSSTAITPTTNLTDGLIQNYAQNVLQMNNGFAQATPHATNTISLPSVNSLSNQIASSLNQSLPSKTYTTRDLTVSADNSTSSQLAYIQALIKLNQKNFQNLQIPINVILENFFANHDDTQLALYVHAAENQVNDLLALPVPEQLAAWHLENINLWAKKLSAYSAILNTNNDPVMATVALKALPEILNENLTLDALIQKQWAMLISS